MRALYQAAPITGIAIIALIVAISTIFEWPGAQTTTQGQAETTPSPPTNLKVVVNAAGTGATVSWEAGGSGVNGNCPTTSYDLTLYNKTDSSVDDVEYEITAPTTTQTITLTAGHNYDVEVYAFGDSCDNYSDDPALLTITATASTTFPLPTNTPAPTATATNTPDPSASATTTPTATPSTTPSTPINLKVVVNAAGTGATVSWASGGSGVNGNCPTTRYALTLYNKTDGTVENVEHEITAPTTTKAITLTAGQEYDVEIYAIGQSCGVYSDSPAVLRFTATASATFPTPTATVTNTPAPTHTPDPSASATSTPTTTDTPTATPTATPRTRPNTPINLKVAVNSDGTSATVSWASGGSGVNGNCPTTRYHVTLLVIDDSDNAAEVSTARVSDPTTTHTVTLTAGQKYNIQVNAYGSSCTGYSALPANLDFTATASTTFPPSPTPTPTVTDTPTITPTPTVTNTPAPTDTPTATNTPDPSATATPTATATATPSVRPNKPTNLQVAVNSDGTSATVSWESGGSGAGGNCPATRYDLTLDNLSDNSVENVLHLVVAPTTTQTVTLTPGQNYNVQISVYGNSCRGFSESRASLDFTATASTSFTATPTPTVTNTPDPAASDTPTPTVTATNTPDPAASDTPTPSITPTPSARPNTPINLKVAVNSDGTSATVSWESGGSGVGGNCPATRYDLRLYNLTDNNVDSVVHLITPPTTTQTVTLTAGQNYNVEVSAYGSSCNGFSESRARLDFTATASTTFTPTATPTVTNTPDPAATDTPTPTPTATNTPDPAASDTPTPSITPTPSVRPNEPINIQVAVNSDGTSATVSWESGGSGVGGNCPSTRYDLTLINLSDSSVENVSRQITAPATTQTLTLTAGQNYNVQVYARGNSCSEFSEFPANLHFTATASTTFTPSPTATSTATPTATNTPDPAATDTPTPTATPSIRPNPAAYISVDVAATGTSATVTWRPGGNGVGGNCPTTQYQVVLNVNGAWQIPDNGSVQQPTNGQPTLELTGLTSGDSYIVGVDAFGDACDTWSLRARLSFTATPSSVFGSATPTPINTPDPTASATPTPTATATNTPDPSATATPTPTTRIPAATATAKPGTTRPRTATPTARPGTSRPRTATPTAVTRRHPVSRIEPSTRDETVISAGNKITLRVMPYGQQNMMDTNLSAGRGLTWKQGSITLTDDDKRTPWTIRYTAPSSPGTYRVTASLADCTPASEARRATSCSAEFTIRVRRPAPGQTDPSTPVNPPGNIPALIPDSDGNQYGVFTPVDGGTFDSGEGYSIVAEAGVIPNGEFIGVRMSDQGTASNVGMTHHRYTLGGNIYAISAVDSGGTIVSSYILDKAATVCIPLPVELRSKLSDVALVAINNDDTLTILSSSVRLNSSGDTMVCGSLSSLPAQIAVGSAGSPAAIPAPTPEPSPLPPETGGATPTSNSIIWVLILGSAIAIFGSTLLIARRRESAKN